MATRIWLGIGAALLLLALAVRPARADGAGDDEATVARRALIVLRILAYDKALAKRAPGPELIVFVVASTSPQSRTERERWLAGFALLPRVKAGGRPVRTMAIDYQDAPAFEALVGTHRPAAMILTEGLGFAATALRRIARARQVVSVSTRETDVRNGYAIGLIAGDSRDEIVINLEAARAEGARFGAGLLQLARIVDSADP